MLKDILDVDRIFSDRDFEEMMYPIHRFKEETNLLSIFKGLKELPAFSLYKDTQVLRNRAIKYVIYCYDRESPIFKKFQQDDVKRKTTAAIYAGWVPDQEDGLFPEQVNDVLMGFNHSVNMMIIDYVRQYMDPEFSVLVTGYESLYTKLKIISTSVSKPDKVEGSATDKDYLSNEKKRGELFTQAQALSQELSSLAHKILTDDNKILKKDLYSVIDPFKKKRLGLSPEEQAGVI